MNWPYKHHKRANCEACHDRTDNLEESMASLSAALVWVQTGEGAKQKHVCKVGKAREQWVGMENWRRVAERSGLEWKLNRKGTACCR